MARRDDREYREYLSEEQRSQRGPQRGSRVGVERGCIARRMQPDFRHGLLASRLVWGVALASLAAASTAVSTAAGAAGATDWPSTNYDQSANRYSPLTQITAKNVSTLQQIWSFHFKPADFTGRMREDEAIPIVIGNTMYLASPYGAVIALDATTGAEKWRFPLPNNEQPSKRGVAYWPGGSGGGGGLPLPSSIVFGSTTGKLYSVKASD